MIFSAVVLVAGVCLVRAYPGGPPSSTCSTLAPSHGTSGQTSAVPYQINLDQFSDGNGGYAYTPGQTYTLTLSDPAGSTFRGFFVQSRLAADDTTRVGTFAVVNSGSSKLSPCSTPQDGIVHDNTARTDFSSMTMEWTAPPAGTGPIQFAYAVVRVYVTFWANQRSATLQEAPETAETSSLMVAPTTSLAASPSSTATAKTSLVPTLSVAPSSTASATDETPSTTTALPSATASPTPLLETVSPTPSATPGTEGSSSVPYASLLLLLLSMGAVLLLF